MSSHIEQLENQYRQLQKQIVPADDGIYYKEACDAILSAVEIQVTLANYFTGPEREKHLNLAEELLAKASDSLDKRGKTPSPQAAKKTSKDKSTTTNSADEVPSSASSEKSNQEESSEEDDDSMFQVTGNPNINLDDLVGMRDVKVAIENIELPQKYPEQAKKYGVIPQYRLLLYGPPGTGKTTVAKAVATKVLQEGGKFFEGRCSQLRNKLVGETEKQIDKMFDEVCRSGGSDCFLLDDFDAIAPDRSGDIQNFETSMVTTLLHNLDTMQRDYPNIYVIANTNHRDKIDSAVLSRFPQSIYVGLPDFESRRAFFEKNFTTAGEDHSALELGTDLSLDDLAHKTEGSDFRFLNHFVSSVRMKLFRAAVETDQPQILSSKVVEEALAETKMYTVKDEI